MSSLPTLPSGAYPLTRGQGYAAAVFVALAAAALALFVPVLARAANMLALPPDAVRFGAASLVPPLPDSPTARGWRVTQASTDSVTLTKGGVTVQAQSGLTTQELQEQFEQLLAGYPVGELSSGEKRPEVLGPTQFRSSTTASDGYIAWLDGDSSSAVLAVIPTYQRAPGGSGTQYVQLVAYGPSKAMARMEKEIDAILGSVRFTLVGGP